MWLSQEETRFNFAPPGQEGGMAVNGFNKYHPAVIFMYFAAVMVITVFVFDPVLLGIFLISQSAFYLYLKGMSGELVLWVNVWQWSSSAAASMPWSTTGESRYCAG